MRSPTLATDSRKGEFSRTLERLDQAKRATTIIACILVVAGGVLQDVIPQFLPIAILLYLTAITAILLEIHAWTAPSLNVYSSLQAAATVLLEEIQKGSRRKGRCDILWLGVTMQSAWLTIENAIGRDLAECAITDIHIRLLQSDPGYLLSILKSDDSTPQLTAEQAQYIARFCERNSNALKAGRSTISIAQYAYMPNYHGLLINESVLYLSTVRWTGGEYAELSVPHEPFERFDRSTPRGQYMIDLYCAWVEKGFREATSLKTYPTDGASVGGPRTPSSAA